MAVDSKHKLIVCSDVVNKGFDTQPLVPMAIKAKETLEVEHLIVDADTGYDNREPIKAGVDAGMTPDVPLADKEAPTRKEGRLVRSEFTSASYSGYVGYERNFYSYPFIHSMLL
jgi:hypothetical protein